MKWQKLKFILFFVVVSNTIIAQINTGVDISYQSSVLYNSNDTTTLYKFNFNNPGVGLSCYAKTNIYSFQNKFGIKIGASIGIAHNRIGKVGFHYPKSKEEQNKTFTSFLGLNYLDNLIFVDLEIFNFLVIEVGMQNRILLFRNTSSEMNRYFNNNNEKEYIIPKIYNDFYSSIALKLGEVILNYKIFNIDRNVFIEDFSKSKISIGKQNPTIYKLSLIHIFSLAIPLKSYKTTKSPIFKY